MRKLSRGVTLIELMVVMVIIAILASIAVPSYRSYLLRTHRTSATASLLRIQQAQEKFFLANNVYATTLAGLGTPATSDNGAFYDLSLDPASTTAFTIHARANGTGKQTDDKRCAEFTIDQNGTRVAKDANGGDSTAECWR